MAPCPSRTRIQHHRSIENIITPFKTGVPPVLPGDKADRLGADSQARMLAGKQGAVLCHRAGGCIVYCQDEHMFPAESGTYADKTAGSVFILLILESIAALKRVFQKIAQKGTEFRFRNECHILYGKGDFHINVKQGSFFRIKGENGIDGRVLTVEISRFCRKSFPYCLI